MFDREAEALAILARAAAIRVPQAVCQGGTSGMAFLVLEYLPLANRGSFAEMGRRLAKLHAVTNHCFGWHVDNYIGTTPQRNAPSADWIGFFRDQRLAFQIELARRGGLALPQAGVLLANLQQFFEGYQPLPSLLHGDLWSGNAGFLHDSGEPVLFDPACYYGDRECDLAFTEMFGGFAPQFFQAYRAQWPLAAGYGRRKRLYNLYHELNHFNLFGGSYGSQARATIAELCSQL
jgi:fructosamine-3-kinase